MKIYKCDRCGKCNAKGFIQLTKDIKSAPRYIDLCGECLSSFKRWMKERKKESDDEQR